MSIVAIVSVLLKFKSLDVRRTDLWKPKHEEVILELVPASHTRKQKYSKTKL